MWAALQKEGCVGKLSVFKNQSALCSPPGAGESPRPVRFLPYLLLELITAKSNVTEVQQEKEVGRKEAGEVGPAPGTHSTLELCGKEVRS